LGRGGGDGDGPAGPRLKVGGVPGAGGAWAVPQARSAATAARAGSGVRGARVRSFDVI
jgi:hypothetical protein